MEHMDSKSNLASLNLNDFLQMNFFRNYETGKISSHQFRNEVRHFLNINLSDQEFDDIWNATLIAPYEDSYEMLKKLKEKYTLALLSNTNEIHFNRFYPECKKFLDLFDYTFYSHKIGFMKPDAASFHYVLEQFNTIPETVLFIDDLERNIVAAKSLGIQTFLFDYAKNRDFLLKQLSGN
jgi:putative hydrolase of the HAD superfamily